MGASLPLCVTVPTCGEGSWQFEEEWHWGSCWGWNKEGTINRLVALVTVISRVYTSLQICLFLIKLSRAFSSYYSRVKILLVSVPWSCLPSPLVCQSIYLSTPQAAEPHLVPLIHARLHLMAAIKQTMYNALSLLAIEPFEQLWIFTSWNWI